jgi:acetolactate decarboxylase
MKHALVLFFSLVCCSVVNAQDAIYYVSLNRTVRLGHYDGVQQLKEIKQHGNFGLGSIDRIAGELVMINDTAYQFSADGKAKIMDPQTKLPFAAVKFFKAEKTYPLDNSYTLKELQSFLDSVLYKNSFAAIRITGQFQTIEYFCYQPQQKPYRPIEQAEKKTRVDSNTSGTMVGFHSPRSAEIINSPEYHFHFLTTQRDHGGHVQDCQLKKVLIEIDYAGQLIIGLPDPASLTDIDLQQPVTH